VFPAGEAQAGIAATAALQGELNAAEVRLAGLLLGGTEQNSEVVQARAQVAQLRAQLGHQQADSSASAGLASNKRLPSLALAFAQREREVRLKETVFEALVQQYEKARLSSIDPGPQLQIVDQASAPEKKAGPNRRLIVIAGAAFGLFAGLAGLLLLDPLRQLLLLLRGAPLAMEE
jgi:tyrosine-protein kinase Etk/Wzc